MKNEKDLKVAMAKHIEKDIKRENLTIGDVLADKITAIMGSYGFLVSNLIVIFGYIVLQKFICFDPTLLYLNFALSFQAAVGMPILQMSSNRQSQVDRRHMQLDMEVNVQTKELIELMHKRIDEQDKKLEELKQIILEEKLNK